MRWFRRDWAAGRANLGKKLGEKWLLYGVLTKLYQ
jgi:hypothetical protein